MAGLPGPINMAYQTRKRNQIDVIARYRLISSASSRSRQYRSRLSSFAVTTGMTLRLS